MLSLRNRFRAATKSLMADHSSSQSPPTQKKNYTKPVPSFLGSPRFKAFTFNKCLPDSDPIMSPTSILDTTRKLFPTLKNPLWLEPSNQPKSPRFHSEDKPSWDKIGSKGIGVALVDEATPAGNPAEEDGTNNSRLVLFCTKLRVQIPSLMDPTLLSPPDSPDSPPDFGIKTRNPQLLSLPSGSPRIATGHLSPSEMELSEDYTCVISHGPIPRTTHIFDNCVVENFCSGSSPKGKEPRLVPSPKSFLSYCHTCNKNLEQKNDIYIYRGEKAFCSRECRHQEMILDDGE